MGFPPSNAEIYYNDAGEPTGWDVPGEAEYFDCCGNYGRCVCDDYEEDEGPDANDDGIYNQRCRLCAPFDCDDPDNHLGVPSKYTPLKNKGCRCGADSGGWDCMCFEAQYD